MKINTPITDHAAEMVSTHRCNERMMVAADVSRQLETAKNENWQEVLDWERWAKEVCEDFRIPFDNHKVGLRMAITKWMAERMAAMPNESKLSHGGGES